MRELVLENSLDLKEEEVRPVMEVIASLRSLHTLDMASYGVHQDAQAVLDSLFTLKGILLAVRRVTYGNSDLDMFSNSISSSPMSSLIGAAKIMGHGRDCVTDI